MTLGINRSVSTRTLGRGSTKTTGLQRHLSTGDLDGSIEPKPSKRRRVPRAVATLGHSVFRRTSVAKVVSKKVARKLLPQRSAMHLHGLPLNSSQTSGAALPGLRISAVSHSGAASLSDETTRTLEMEEGIEKPPIGAVVINDHEEMSTSEDPEEEPSSFFVDANYALQVIRSGGPVPIVAVLAAIAFYITGNTLILRIYPLLVVLHIMEIASKWCRYVSESNAYGLLRKAHHYLGKLAQDQITKSHEGGKIRRRMEIYAFGVWHEMLKQTYHIAMYGEPSEPIDLDD